MRSFTFLFFHPGIIEIPVSCFYSSFQFRLSTSVSQGYIVLVAAVSDSTESLSTEHRDERVFYVPGRMQV